MQEKNRYVGGVSGQEVDPTLLREKLFEVLKLTALTGATGLGTAAVLQQRRAQRLDVTAKALAGKLGKDHPDALAVAGMAQAAGDLRVSVSEQTKRARSFPKLHANEWIVFGTVRDQNGQPAGGLTVRVFDRDRKYDDLLGETETDEHGDFSTVYHERDFKETRENLPELYVMVSDAKGALLYTSRDNVRFNAGRAEYFLIRLGASDVPKPRATRTTGRKAKSG